MKDNMEKWDEVAKEISEADPAKSTQHHSAGTFTIKSSGGDYTNISNWDAGEACDLTGAGQSIAECYDEWASGLDDKVDINRASK